MKEFLKSKIYVFLIIFLIILQLFLSVYFKENVEQGEPEVFVIFIPWLYFLAFYASNFDHFHYNKLFPNQKNFSLIIQSLSIKTYNYHTLEEEYLDFISDIPYEEFNPDFIEDHMWYILIDHGEKIDAKDRSMKAQNLSFIYFCVALELKRLLKGQCPDRFDLKHFIFIANKWYNQHLEDYYLSYYFTFRFKAGGEIHYSESYPEVNCFLNYIYDCFFSNQEPSYEQFLVYATTFEFKHDKELINNNFKELQSLICVNKFSNQE